VPGHSGDEAEDRRKPEPDDKPQDHRRRRHTEEEQLVIQTPAKNPRIGKAIEVERQQQRANQPTDEHSVPGKPALRSERFPMLRECEADNQRGQTNGEQRTGPANTAG